MTQLLTLEGLRIPKDNRKKFKKSIVTSRTKKRYELATSRTKKQHELNGILSRAKKSVSKTVSKAAKSTVGKVAKASVSKISTTGISSLVNKVTSNNPISKQVMALQQKAIAVSKKAVGIPVAAVNKIPIVNKVTKPVSKITTKVTSKVSVNPLSLAKKPINIATTNLKQISTSISNIKSGNYSSAAKAVTPITLIPKTVRQKTISTIKSTSIGKGIVNSISAIDKKIDRKVNQKAKGVFVKLAAAKLGPAGAALANQILPEGKTDYSSSSTPVATTEKDTNDTSQAQDTNVTSQAQETAASKSSGAGLLIAALGTAAMFLT